MSSNIRINKICQDCGEEWDRIIVPEIRLQGIWLKELGFEHGKQIKVEKHKDKLVITLEEKEN